MSHENIVRAFWFICGFGAGFFYHLMISWIPRKERP